MSEEEKKLKLAHRDDVDMDVVEDIESFFAENLPGFKVQFAGDQPGQISEEMKEALAKLEEKTKESFIKGQCIDCGKQMENWPPPEDDAELENWERDEGWVYFCNSGSDEIVSWQCPECDKADPDGINPINLKEFLDE